ncbi:hypothetical protein [Pontimicrobium aquaticum]|uniref:Trehalose utilisation n=1 Tax=Pontimicrobium aquaticum TaxID=2565367 RepID=A0A4U0F123_9FLAO|nr:hypothetical protein [Pontimicrobium aquaticum]TJY38073.1 hypothetical protein E5167_02105 [Pontimicrobium aquaticum]
MKKNLYHLIFFIGTLSYAQGTVEAEIDTLFKYQFKSLKDTHQKKILIDKGHNTIYSIPSGEATAREMFRIIETDGFEVRFTNQKLDSTYLSQVNPDLLIVHGMPNNKTILKNGDKEEILYTSPLKNIEVESIAKYVNNGGSLLLFLSHFPGGSGALPLLEAFSVKFRDGYAYHNQYHTTKKKGICGHFRMNTSNGMLNLNHPLFTSSIDKKTIPTSVRFYCGAAIFRNPEDEILPFPNNTVNYTKTTTSKIRMEETSNDYAGMIGFEYGKGRVIICTDQGIFRSLNLFIENEKIAVTIHDPETDNAGLLVNTLRWLTKLQ